MKIASTMQRDGLTWTWKGACAGASTRRQVCTIDLRGIERARIWGRARSGDSMDFFYIWSAPYPGGMRYNIASLYAVGTNDACTEVQSPGVLEIEYVAGMTSPGGEVEIHIVPCGTTFTG